MLPWQLAEIKSLYFIFILIIFYFSYYLYENVFNGLNFSLRFGINELYSPDLNIFYYEGPNRKLLYRILIYSYKSDYKDTNQNILL